MNTDVDVWCIQVITKDREVLHEEWVQVALNPDFKYPVHGSTPKDWKAIDPTITYHLTPFKRLERNDYLTKGKPKG